MLTTHQISQPAGFGSILSASQKSSNSSNKLSSKRRAANARQQSIGGQISAEPAEILIKTNGDITRSDCKSSQTGEENVGQVAPEEHSLEAATSQLAGYKQGKQSGSNGHQRGRRHLTNMPKHSENSEDQATVTSSDGKPPVGDTKKEEEVDASGVDDKKVESSDLLTTSELEKPAFKVELVWTNIMLFVVLHSCLPIGLYMLYTQRPWLTLAYSILGMYASGLGVTGGTHRLWSHRSYKASWPVQFLLMALQTMAGQNSIYTWSRDHRVHHKFSETDADPHNIKRGFFFAHMGWLCCKKHPDVKEKGKLIDMSDLEANPLVMFQHRHFWWLAILFTVLVPTMIPVLLWGERFWTSFIFSFMVRYLITLHGTWLVNSAAHYYGSRPYDTKIEARESPYVIYNGLGEGFHNYHHTFPYDYATSEFGQYFNITTAFIDLCAALGLAHDRRKVDQETIVKRRLRTGDLDEHAEAQEKNFNQANGRAQQVNGSKLLTSNGLVNRGAQVNCRRTVLQKSIDELEESGLVPSERSNPLAPLSNIIHELPYISGLTSMKYTM